MEQVKEEGGRNMYCPKCSRFEQCKSIALETIDKQRLGKAEPFRWYRRTRQCLGCAEKFQTVEIDENELIGLIDSEAQLIELREKSMYLRAELADSKNIINFLKAVEEDLKKVPDVTVQLEGIKNLLSVISRL